MSIDSRATDYGKIFGDWMLHEMIGKGSNGRTAVFRITRNNRTYEDTGALKVVNIVEQKGRKKELSEEFLQDYEKYCEEFCEKAENELSLMNLLGASGNIVSYHDHRFEEWEDDYSFGIDLLIRMDLLESLDKNRKMKTLSEQEIIKIGKDISKALICCHDKGILHRDIKPGNIFFNKYSYMLGDFGISKMMSSNSATETRTGTEAYAAPEQFIGHYDHRVDIYSLGLTLYELANGNKLPFAKTPFAGPEEVQMRLNGKTLPRPESVDDALAEVILKACAHNQEERYQNAAEFYSALEKVANNIDTEAGERNTSSKAVPVKEKAAVSVQQYKDTPNKNTIQKADANIQSSNEHSGRMQNADIQNTGMPSVNTENAGMQNEGMPTANTKNVGIKNAGMSVENTKNVDIQNKGIPTANTRNVGIKNAGMSVANTQNADIQNKGIPTANTQNAIIQKEEKKKAKKKKQDVHVTEKDIEVKKKDKKRKVSVWKILVVALVLCMVVAGGLGAFWFSQQSTAAKLVNAGLEIKVTLPEVPDMETVTVPNLQGLTQAESAELCEKLGLQLQVSEEYSNNIKKGEVISQNPEADAKIDIGSEVYIVVSKGSEKITVPNVVGLKQNAAKERLKDSGLKCKIETEYSSTVEKGKVIKQSVKKGSKVGKKTVVIVTISKGKKVTAAPKKSYVAPTSPPVVQRPTKTAAPKKSESSKKKNNNEDDFSEWNMVN